MGDERTRDALHQMRVFLAEHYPELHIVGDVQILGYNSPFVLPWKKLWALQFEVQAKRDLNTIISF